MDFDQRVAFFRAVGRSQGVGVLTMALIQSTVDPGDRPAVRAARTLLRRGNGSDRRRRIAMERDAFNERERTPA